MEFDNVGVVFSFKFDKGLVRRFVCLFVCLFICQEVVARVCCSVE